MRGAVFDVNFKKLRGFFSDQAFRLAIRIDPERFIKIAYRSILTREADAIGLAAYSKKLKRTYDYADLLQEVSRSDEHWKKSLDARAPDLVHSVYRGLLDREADIEGLRAYSALVREKSIVAVLQSMTRTEEFFRAHSLNGLSDATCSKNLPNPKVTYEKQTVVFLHIQKTAGSSLNNILAHSYGGQNVCFPPENGSGIYKLSAGELSRYTAFLGHFNFDDLLYIPRKNLSVFCFVRNPKNRLLSSYYYWRAHEPDHADYHFIARMANSHTLREFLENDQIKMRPEVWNHMTWAIMGERQWREWQKALAATPNHALLLNSIRATIYNQLRKLIFVGLQEDFDKSVELLFRILGRQKPEVIPSINTLDSRMSTDPNFKKKIERQAITQEDEDALERVLEIDLVLYEEAKALFEEQLSLQ